VEGLLGERGLDPVKDQMPTFHSSAQKEYFDEDEPKVEDIWFKKYRFLRYPTLFWWSSKDWFLRSVCLFGALCSVCIIVGTPFLSTSLPWMMIGLWWSCCLVHSSISQVCSIFGLQTESMMIESTFIFGLASGITIHAHQWWLTRVVMIFGGTESFAHSLLESSPNLCLLLIRWLAFRIMLSAGTVKWYGSSEWKQLSAMSVHYLTMPLPSRISRWFYELPTPIHRLETLVSLLIEGPMCFLSLIPWNVCRYLAGSTFIGLMIVINITGIFCYLGLLTSVICSSLFDDQLFGWILTINLPEIQIDPNSFDFVWIVFYGSFTIVWMMILGIYLAMTWVTLCISANRRGWIPRSWLQFFGEIQHTNLVHVIAFFSKMTTYRWELMLEGSLDGQTWKRYEFLYKPSHPNSQPRWNPIWYWPRLDWMLWGVPLRIRPMLQVISGQVLYPPWLDKLLQNILDDNPHVMKLIKTNPFQGQSVKYVRIMMYDYQYVVSDRTIMEKNRAQALQVVQSVISGSEKPDFGTSRVTLAPKTTNQDEIQHDLQQITQTLGEWWIETGPIALIAERPPLKYLSK